MFLLTPCCFFQLGEVFMLIQLTESSSSYTCIDIKRTV